MDPKKDFRKHNGLTEVYEICTNLFHQVPLRGGFVGNDVMICKCSQNVVVLKFRADRKMEPTTFSAKLVIFFSIFGPRQNTAATQGLPETMKLTAFEGQFQQFTEAVSPSVLPPSALPLDLLNNAVTAFSTLEDLIRYLEPDRWQLDLEDLYRPTWQLLGKAFVFGRKSRVVDLNLLKEEVRLYSCTPRNFSVSIREELKRTDTIFWPGCLLVKRCGGNCACCLHNCNECQCVPSKVTKKYHEVLQLRPKNGVRGLHKSLTDVALEHHEECDCVCRGNSGG
ncbi:hypothetical protein HPG69_006615 [Diceros bicornis minor]|uniref:Platelet-derived growth factor (PDGF) family profile domain-containing protein n=1 Tax=Diceros bicornis minor TaxID=77932 RepID=A0A7J7F6S7_DICBM|nr:hypothetical protein HPG69_006615 [Diceros bicornis minor]